MDFRNSQTNSNARRYPEPTRSSAQSNDTNVSATAQGEGAGAPSRTNMQMQHSEGKSNKPMMIVIIVVVIALVLAGVWFAWSKMAGGVTGVKTNQYQAVFLTNGQVYFGKVADVNDDYVKLSDIYYLQVQQNVQPDNSENKDSQSQVSLAKLGSELHGPEDTMYISRQQVLFWENLKNDGKVVQAIDSYKQSN